MHISNLILSPSPNPTLKPVSFISRLYLNALVLKFELDVERVAVGLLMLSLRHLTQTTHLKNWRH